MLVDFFRRGHTPRDTRLLAARGELAAAPHERLALLLFLTGDDDAEVAAAAESTLSSLPVEPLRDYLARADVPAEIRAFFATRGVQPAIVAGGDACLARLFAAHDDQDEGDAEDGEVGPGTSQEPAILSGLPIKQKIKLASKGSREQRAQLIRDPNRIVAAAVLSSPKLTDAEVESFAKMQNVAEDVLRVIGTKRAWLKNYGVTLGLVRNAKTPIAISMQLLQRITERDMKMLAVDRNVPEALRLAARKFIVKTPR